MLIIFRNDRFRVLRAICLNMLNRFFYAFLLILRLTIGAKNSLHRSSFVANAALGASAQTASSPRISTPFDLRRFK